jgi:hypothetical protein
MSFHPAVGTFRVTADPFHPSVILLIDVIRCIAAARATGTFRQLDRASSALHGVLEHPAAEAAFGKVYEIVRAFEDGSAEAMAWFPPGSRHLTASEARLAEAMEARLTTAGPSQAERVELLKDPVAAACGCPFASSPAAALSTCPLSHAVRDQLHSVLAMLWTTERPANINAGRAAA